VGIELERVVGSEEVLAELLLILRTFSMRFPTSASAVFRGPFSCFSILERSDIKVLELLKASSAFLIAVLSFSDIFFEFKIVGAASEKNLSKD